MGININQGQGPVPLEQPRQGNNVAAGTQVHRAKAGNLAGGNLQVGHGSNGAMVGLGNQKGIPRPVLVAPNQNPNVAEHQAAMGSLDQLVNEWAEGGSLLKDLKKAKSPSHLMSKSAGANSVAVQETKTGFSGVLDGQDFKVDVANKNMKFMAEGQQIDIQFSADGSKLQSATANGEPLNLGDSEVGTMNHFFMLMALFHEMGVEQRQFSRQGRNMANKSVVEKIKAQAQEQRSAAAAKLAAGCVSGAVKVASGALQMVGSMKGMKANENAAQGSNPGDVIAQQWTAMGRMVEGLGEASASTLQYKAGLHEAQSTELRAEEEQARFVKQTEQDQMQIANELSSKARETFAQTFNQYLQTKSNIARNI